MLCAINTNYIHQQCLIGSRDFKKKQFVTKHFLKIDTIIIFWMRLIILINLYYIFCLMGCDHDFLFQFSKFHHSPNASGLLVSKTKSPIIFIFVKKLKIKDHHDKSKKINSLLILIRSIILNFNCFVLTCSLIKVTLFVKLKIPTSHISLNFLKSHILGPVQGNWFSVQYVSQL